MSTGTLFAYFPSKEVILFPEEREFYEQLQQRLEQRPPDATTFDVLHDLLATRESPDETLALRMKILRDEGCVTGSAPGTRASSDCWPTRSPKTSARGPTTFRPTLRAASAAAALATVGERLGPETGEPISHHQALAILDEMFNFLRTGLDQLQPAR